MRRVMTLLLVAFAALFALPALASKRARRAAGAVSGPVGRLEARPGRAARRRRPGAVRNGDDRHRPGERRLHREVTQDAREITPQRLESVDVLVFYTTGALPLSPEAWAACQQRVASGKLGFVGLHSATDTGWDYTAPARPTPPSSTAKFAGHPWTQGTPIRSRPWIPAWILVGMWPAASTMPRRSISTRTSTRQGPRAADPGLRRHAAEAALRRADRLGPPDRPGPAVLHQSGPHALDLGRSALPPRSSRR
jgi:hypothetical protein